jgi:hypothetical protein
VNVSLVEVFVITWCGPLPETTSTCCPGHGLFTVSWPLVAAWIAAVTSWPFSTCTSTLSLCCM